MTPLSVPVPSELAETLGYPGDARFVAFCWEPAGDEVVYEDGRLGGTGDLPALGSIIGRVCSPVSPAL